MGDRIIADGSADMVSMARPLLADADFVVKAAAGRADEINTCIACNQACLDHVFQRKIASCLVNPRAGHETELQYVRTVAPKRIAIVGAGPAGLACATVLAERGHAVDVYEAAADIGGQFNMAKRIPGKEEFHETLRYFRRRIEVTGVRLQLGIRVDAQALLAAEVRRDRARHRRAAARSATFLAKTSSARRAVCSPTSTCCCTAARSERASRSSAPVASASTSPNSSPRGRIRRRSTRRPGCANGA